MAQKDTIKLFQTTYSKINGPLGQKPNHEPIMVYTPHALKLFPPYKTMSILRKAWPLFDKIPVLPISFTGWL